MAGTVTQLEPRYMQEFRCIGSSCEDSCCAGWRVDIDKRTYKLYQKTPDPTLNRLLEKHLGRNRAATSDERFGYIKLNPEGACPFLDGQKLCQIQSTLGEKALSITCATFPRAQNQVDHLYELSATLACPTAAKLALSNPEPMAFDTREVTAQTLATARILETQSAASKTNVRAHFWRLRLTALDLLQNRTYALWERLVLLGIFTNRIDALLKDARGDEIDSFIDSFTSSVADHSMAAALKELPTHAEFRVGLLGAIIEATSRKDETNSDRFAQCRSWLHAGIGWDPARTIESVAESYQSALDGWYEPFMRSYGHVLEHYLVNHVFKSQFPLGSAESPFTNYVAMVAQYVILKTYLVGICGHFREQMTLDYAIMLIQSFAKSIEHNNVYLSAILEFFTKNGFDSMAYMSILLKDSVKVPSETHLPWVVNG